MIKFQKGNLFEADTEAIVNTVNLVGVMGKGIALQFKKKFPENFVAYKNAIDQDVIGIGRLFVTQPTHLFFKYIINFPTKIHWRNRSQYEYVEKGMRDLIQIIIDKGIKSIAIPPLGAGNGKLDWELVRPIIEKYAKELPEVEFYIYEPQPKFDKLDNKRSTNAKLTKSRALLLGVFFAFQQENENLNILRNKKYWNT